MIIIFIIFSSDRKKREALSNFVNSLVRTLTPQQVQRLQIVYRGSVCVHCTAGATHNSLMGNG